MSKFGEYLNKENDLNKKLKTDIDYLKNAINNKNIDEIKNGINTVDNSLNKVKQFYNKD